MLTVLCYVCATARIVPTQHGSREDAETSASEADPQWRHHSFTEVPSQTLQFIQGERPRVQRHCETVAHYLTHQ